MATEGGRKGNDAGPEPTDRRPPPTTSAGARKEPAPTPSNLPAQITPLVGRQRELGDLEAILLRADVPLLTITGTGGVGKTRLALRLAAHVADDFADGVFLVTLAPLRDPDLVPGTIAGVLGVPSGRQPVEERLREHLHGRQMLLLLDNFEHLASAAPAVSELLYASRHLKILVTSRAPLHIAGEHEYPLEPLPVPPASHQLSTPDGLAQFESVKLFVNRAQAVDPSFRLCEGNVTEVAEICRRLEGLPLALELAASRSKLFGTRALLGRLDRRLEFLTGGVRDGPERQRTLRNTIDWSYELLTENQKKLFRRLAVFDTNVGLAGVERVCGGPGDLPSLVDDLQELVDQSLVKRVDDDCEVLCVDMLETLREYGREELLSSGEDRLIRHIHAQALADWAEGLDDVDGRGRSRLQRIEMELTNFRTALEWALASGETDLAFRLARILADLWENNAYLNEGRAWLEQVLRLEAPGDERLGPRAHLLHSAALLATRQADWASATNLATESLEAYRSLSDRKGEAHALLTVALVATMQGDYVRSVELHRHVVPLFEELGDDRALARACHNYGLAHRFENPMEALRLGQRSLELYRQAKSQRGEAQALNLIGWARLNQGDTAGAQESFVASLLGSWRSQAKWLTAHVLQGLADAARRQRDPLHATRLCSASERLFSQSGTFLRQAGIEEHYRALVEDLRKSLGDELFQEAWDEGRRLVVDELVERLEGGLMNESSRPAARGRVAASELPAPLPGVLGSAQLTRREGEVLDLVAQGLSDRQIAKRLGISPTTASKHVANILGKTGSRNRVQLTRLALSTSIQPSRSEQ